MQSLSNFCSTAGVPPSQCLFLRVEDPLLEEGEPWGIRGCGSLSPWEDRGRPAERCQSSLEPLEASPKQFLFVFIQKRQIWAAEAVLHPSPGTSNTLGLHKAGGRSSWMLQVTALRDPPSSVLLSVRHRGPREARDPQSPGRPVPWPHLVAALCCTGAFCSAASVSRFSTRRSCFFFARLSFVGFRI